MPHRPALLLLLALAACKPGGQAEAPLPPDPPKPVQVAGFHPAPIQSATALTGTIRARREADIGFRAGGRIAERLVNLGDTVQPGQLLARLDPADLTLSQRAAEADLASAQAQYVQAANDAQRSAMLLAAGHVAPAFNDQRVAASRAARERVISAEAALSLARNRLSYTTLLAPNGGIVTALLAEAGQVVAEGTPVLRLANPEEREIQVQVPEAQLARLRERGASARFWSRPEAALPVVLREVAGQAEPGLRTYAARFALANAPDWAQLGMTATITLPSEGGMAARVPLTALHDRGQGPMLWALEGEGRIRAVPARVLAMAETTALVEAELAEGARFIAIGPQLLAPDTRVRVVDTRLAGSLR
jgi:RND family efflux transporter MFP subunit